MYDIEKTFLEMPEGIKEKGLAHHHAFKRLRLAEEQSKLWNEELKQAQWLFNITNKDWTSALNRYNPTTGSVAPDSKMLYEDTL